MNYWKQGHVLEIQLVNREATTEITSRVKDSEDAQYDTHIELLEYDDGEYEIVGECNCPVELDCEHIAATLLSYLNDGAEQTEKTTPDQIAGWIDKLRESRGSTQTIEAPKPDASPYQLLYLLEPSSERNDLYAVHLSTQKARVLKKGGYGKPTGFPLEKASETYYSNDFLSAGDRDIAQLITNSRNFYYFSYSNDYKLKREMGELALRKMLTFGRCFWQDKDSMPLKSGNPRSIEFDWQLMGEGSQLEYQINPPVAQIFRIEDFWYVDMERHEIGPVFSNTMNAEQIQVMLGAPLIPEEQLTTVGRDLSLEFPELDISEPVPLDLEHIDITDQQPEPVLRLCSKKTDDEGHSIQQFFAELMVRYDKVDLPIQPATAESRQVEGDKIYRIQRQLEAEAQYPEQLRDCGMIQVPAVNTGTRHHWHFRAANNLEMADYWYEFIHHEIPQLEQLGWIVEHDDDFNLKFSEAEAWSGELEENSNEWFSLTLGIEVDGQTINLLPLLVDVLATTKSPTELRANMLSRDHYLVELDNAQWLRIPSNRITPILDTLIELFDKDPLDQDGKLLLSKAESLQLGDFLNDPRLHWKGADEMRALAQKIRDFSGIDEVDIPPGFQATLRDYQHEGLNWLQFLREYNFNGILADDMGLGKTAQALAHLLVEKSSGRLDRPALVVAPTSLVGNWFREIQKFTPELSVLPLHGTERKNNYLRAHQFDVLITSYPLLRRDLEQLSELDFHYVILDEAQYIKNPRSQTAKNAFDLKSRHRLCLTGTPVENHLGEFWSMLHFLMPGFLGNLEQFKQRYQNPIEKHQDDTRRLQLRQRIAPFLLRRTKDQVASELPEKTEIIVSVELQGQQRDLYESIRLSMDKKLQSEIGKKGFARSQIMILDALLKLRQVCCDPRLVKLPQAQNVTENAKLTLLMDMLPEMIAEGRRILLFSQFTGVLKNIEDELIEANIGYSKLTGQTRKRDEAIDTFQDGLVPVFLISLKAGGVGLNLTRADTVIHYDPWWNPAAENQATDRAHRIGQDKAVFVYKFITAATVEDRILAMQSRKQALADSLYGERKEDTAEQFSAADLTDLLMPIGDE